MAIPNTIANPRDVISHPPVRVQFPGVDSQHNDVARSLSADSSPHDIRMAKAALAIGIGAHLQDYLRKNDISDRDAAELGKAARREETYRHATTGRDLRCERFDVDNYRGQPLTLILGEGQIGAGPHPQKIAHESFTWGENTVRSKAGRELIVRIKALAYFAEKLEGVDEYIDGVVSAHKRHEAWLAESTANKTVKEAAGDALTDLVLGPRPR